MAARCSFCGSTTGPFSRVEGVFTVLMCVDCLAARGHGAGPYPAMTLAEMRAGLGGLLAVLLIVVVIGVLLLTWIVIGMAIEGGSFHCSLVTVSENC